MSEDDASDEDDMSITMAMELYETLVCTVINFICTVIANVPSS